MNLSKAQKNWWSSTQKNSIKLKQVTVLGCSPTAPNAFYAEVGNSGPRWRCKAEGSGGGDCVRHPAACGSQHHAKPPSWQPRVLCPLQEAAQSHEPPSPSLAWDFSESLLKPDTLLHRARVQPRFKRLPSAPPPRPQRRLQKARRAPRPPHL